VRRVALLSLAVLASALPGCGDAGQADSNRVKGDALTVYASLPAHGLDADAGKAAALGMRQALADAGRRVGGRKVRLTVLPSTRPGDERWDPGTIEANAERAADDATAIAYIGELDQGGSAVSLPVTNRAGILQVSPADGLTSLTRTPPGRPTAGPDRYYPEGARNFARLVPPDIEAARAIVDKLRERGSRRVAVVDGARIADRELESMIAAMIGTGLPRSVARVTVRDTDETVQLREQAADLAEELAAERPDAVLFAASAGPEADALLADLAARLPEVPLWGGPPLALGIGDFSAAPSGACAVTGLAAPAGPSRTARRLLRAVTRTGASSATADALLGYDAMRLTLDAIEEAGADRHKAIAAARAPGPREGLMGRYSMARNGDLRGRRPVCLALLP
jgi:branched-chain amino acid transport system substrate-binding protein